MSNEVIVVVEDDVVTAHALHYILADVAGYSVTVVGDSARALHLLTTRRADLAIVDVYLPDVDGFGLYDLLRTHPATATLPCLFISANGHYEALRSRGITDFLLKPFAPQELLARVDTLLHAPVPPDAPTS